jgi:hypothetical protein
MYFILSFLFTLISMGWFVLDNLLRTLNYQPFILEKIGQLLRKIKLSDLKKMIKCKQKVNSMNLEESKKNDDFQKKKAETKIEVIDLTEKDNNTTNKQHTSITPSTTTTTEKSSSKKKVDECIRCESCLKCDEKDMKDKESKKKKNELDTNLLAINRFLFCFIFFSMFVSNIIIWAYIGSE